MDLWHLWRLWPSLSQSVLQQSCLVCSYQLSLQGFFELEQYGLGKCLRSLWDSFKRSSVCLLCILSNRTLSSAFLVRNGLQSIFGDPLREAVLRFMRIVRMSGLSQVSYAKIPCRMGEPSMADCSFSMSLVKVIMPTSPNHKGSQRHILKSTTKKCG